MPRDTLENTSERAGSLLSAVTARPVRDSTLSNLGTHPIGGDIIIFQDVPHVAWCEVEGDIQTDTISGTVDSFVWHGPYVARWDGGDWELLTPNGALEDVEDFGDGHTFVGASGGPGPRGAPKLATDGTSLYCGVPAAISLQLLDPPGNIVGIYQYFLKWLLYGFRLDGSVWTPLSGALGSMFPSTLEFNIEYYQVIENTGNEVFNWDISASPDAPGQCYFAFSDYGIGDPAPGLSDFQATSHLAVVGTDLPETVLDDYVTGGFEGGVLSPSNIALAGGGSTLALYYIPSKQSPGHAIDWPGDKALIWTPTLETEIDAVNLGIPYVDVDLDFASAVLDQDGLRYITFAGDFDFGGGVSRWFDIIRTADPHAPTAALGHLSTPKLSVYSPVGDTTDLDVAVQLFGISYEPLSLLVEPKNYWLGLYDGSTGVGVRWVAQLDRQCRAPSVGWIVWNLPDSSFSSGRMVLFEDALWWFATNDGIDPVSGVTNVPQVWRTPICRGCADCPPNALHVWQRI